MDGFETLRWIRGEPGGERVKVAAVTANVFDNPRGRTLAAGCDDFLSKPYAVDDIFRLMAKHLGVTYIEAPVANDAEAVRTPKVEELARLAPAMLRELRGALVRLDERKISLLIDQTSEREPVLGAMMRRIAERFDYGMLAQLCDQAMAERQAANSQEASSETPESGAEAIQRE